MNETKTEPTQPAAPAKAAVKPATKPLMVSSNLEAPPMSLEKGAGASVFNAISKTAGDAVLAQTQQPADKAISPLAAFQSFLDKAPKEHLPTMMVRIANKCLAEKVFATPGAMAEAIVEASKK